MCVNFYSVFALGPGTQKPAYEKDMRQGSCNVWRTLGNLYIEHRPYLLFTDKYTPAGHICTAECKWLFSHVMYCCTLVKQFEDPSAK